MTHVASDNAPALQTTAAPAVIPRWVTEAAEPVTFMLRQALHTLHPDLARIGAYHRGWVTPDGTPIGAATSGKAIRAALALWSARSAGAPAEVGLPAAVAVELVHDFSIVHDDIMDDDHTRRGRPTAWTVFGVGPALLLGDALYARAISGLATTGPRGPMAMSMLAQAVAQLCQGQAADLAFERREHVSVQEYLTMIEDKTGALMTCAATLGALLAGGEHQLVTQLKRLGAHIGALFQIVDDLLGVFGDPTVTGKPVGSDIARRKKTFPILAALDKRGPASCALAELLSLPNLTDEHIAKAADLVEQTGGRARARQECEWHHGQALAALTDSQLPADADDDLRELLAFLLDRTC